MGLMIMAGCGGGNTPEGAVQKLIAATRAGDYDAMMACYAPETRKLMEEMVSVTGKEQTKKAMMNIRQGDMPEKMEIAGSKVDGDWGEVAVLITSKGQTSESSVWVHNIKGVWMIDFRDEQKEQMRSGLEAIKKQGGMKKMLEGMKKRIAEDADEAIADETATEMQRQLEKTQKKMLDE